MSRLGYARGLLAGALMARSRGDMASCAIFLRGLRECGACPSSEGTFVKELRAAAEQGPARYDRARKTKDKGRWLTIGKGKHGAKVFVQGGRIKKGCPGLMGKSIEALDKGEDVGDPEPSSHRQQMHQEREYQRAVWAKKARQAGLSPDDLHSLAKDIREHDRGLVESCKHLLQRARQQLAHYGYDARALTTNLRSGHVEDEIPALDVVADSLARSYPEHFRGHEDDLEGRLRDLLTEGNLEAMSESESYEQALAHLQDMTAGGADGYEPDPDFGLDDDDVGGMGEAFEPPAAETPKSQHHPAKIETAWERFNNRHQTARGGGLFGGEDMQARQGFARLPDGAAVLFVGGEFDGQTGKIVHDQGRIVAEVDGRPGLVPIDYSIIEPLSGALSWRTEASAAPMEQRSLLSADLFLPKRDRAEEAEEETVPFRRAGSRLAYARQLLACADAAQRRGDAASAYIFERAYREELAQ
jgi:hypothetical protein